ncbi:LuxR C-terminal-related transcriptional regulator [Thermogemmatispora sp.]|jgi:DNA-binding NarL/FixJ family response regulator|uniref:LuxR C-terminal-related transcriptional regulator n=1 Tax=Thermogemmatispora sp. TaxID=1968838 RepID=UPI0035E41DD4
MRRRAFHCGHRIPRPGGLRLQDWRILALAREGYSHREIATRLGLKYQTIACYLQAIYQILGVHCLREAIECAPWSECPPEALLNLAEQRAGQADRSHPRF